MHISVQNLNVIKNNVKEIIDRKQLNTSPKVIAVSKTFEMENITFNVTRL